MYDLLSIILILIGGFIVFSILSSLNKVISAIISWTGEQNKKNEDN